MDRGLFEAFEAGIDRRGTYCEKWDSVSEVFGRADVLPMWVADMDFASPECVSRALVERASHSAYGYTDYDGPMYGAVCEWMAARHGLAVQPEWVIYSPGVVDSILYALKTVTCPGDGVIVQPPVYGPFFRLVQRAGCEVLRNPLIQTEAGWRMDMEGLECHLKGGAKALILCSPHNPVGRVWQKEELQAVVSLCGRYGAFLIADEIHADFALPGHRHTCTLGLSGAQNVIMLISSTKTFNLAGLHTSSIILQDEDLRASMRKTMAQMGADSPNIFGAVAQTAAYRHGAAWLDALIQYLEGNRAFAHSFFEGRIPQIRPSAMEGTYLMWLDCRGLGLEHKALERFFVDQAGVGLTSGEFFGEEGSGFMRINLAAPRHRVEEGLSRIEEAVKRL
jgi:cystathionine beta-lyase